MGTTDYAKFHIDVGDAISSGGARLCGSLVQGGVLLLVLAVGFVAATLGLKTTGLGYMPYLSFALVLAWVMAARAMSVAMRWVLFFLITLSLAVTSLHITTVHGGEWAAPVLVFVMVALFALVIRLNLDVIGLKPGSTPAQLVVNMVAFAATLALWHASPLTAEVTVPVLIAGYAAMLISSAAAVATYEEAHRTAATSFNTATPCLFVALAPVERFLDAF